AGTVSDSNPLTPADSLYVDWAVINNGSVATTTEFRTELYLDGALRFAWTNVSPLNVGSYVSMQDISIGLLSTGTHTIRIKTDASALITEGDETDNEYTKTIFIGTYSV